MTAEIINLRAARKARARADKDAKAAENRTRFGRTKAEREREAASEEQTLQVWSAHRRDVPETGRGKSDADGEDRGQ